MTWTVTFNNPEYNYTSGVTGTTATVAAIDASMNFDFGAVSGCTLTIAHDVASKYGLETDDTNNPCQLNSTMFVQRDAAFWFRGKVDSRAINYLEDGSRVLVVQCSGKESVLLEALVPDAAGEVRWTLATSTVEVGAAPHMPLVATSEFGTFVNETLWPDPTDAEGELCYIQDASCANDTIDADILIGTAAPFDVLFTTTNKAFSPQGWLKINNEWMYYEGYDPTGAGAKYKVNVKARAQLGSAAAGHTAGDTGYNKVAKIIGPEPPTVYRNDGGGEIRLRNGDDYTVQTEYGCFVIIQATAGFTFTANYYVYDEDGTLGGATIVYLEDVIEAIVTAPLAYGGAGFVAGNCDFDTTGIGITRYDYSPDEKEVYAWNAIHELLDVIGLENEVQFWYDHTTDRLRLSIIGNNPVPDFTFAHCQRVMRNLNSDDLYSGVRVVYTYDQDPNLIQPIYSSHVGCAAVGNAPDEWIRTTAGGESWSDGTNTANTDAGRSNFGVDMLIDGKLESKLKARIYHDPGADFEYCDFWFDSGSPVPGSILLDEIVMYVNAYRTCAGRTNVNENETFVVAVHGCADYNCTTFAGSFANLGAKIEGKATRDGTSVKHVMNNFIQREVNAIRIVFEYMAGPIDSGHKYWAILHELQVRGNVKRRVLVQTSDTEQNDPYYVYDVDAHKKLRGGILSAGSAGSPKIKGDIDIGAASESGAITIARAYLQTALKLYEAREYNFQGEMTSKPELGDTVEVDEDGDTAADYTGVIRNLQITINSTGINADFTLLDNDAGAVS
ncbi:MAG TPA: hypothetical protein VLH56_19250 [Dissulfurispiraceae bacterium]|nr:hypothetical protein [Dissulfurispiraceae bacterium]